MHVFGRSKYRPSNAAAFCFCSYAIAICFVGILLFLSRRLVPSDNTKLAFDNQITAYSLVAPELGFGAAKVTIQALLKQKKPDLALYRPERSKADRGELVELIAGVAAAVRIGAFYPVRDWWCRGCEYASACVAG